MRVTACIILRSMFGMDISEERLRSLEGDVEDMIRFVNSREMLPLKPPLWAPLPSHRRYQEARARVHALIREVIARRRAEPQASWPNDLLSKLMLARDEETGETMTDMLVHDESLGIFVAGHETTARTMSFLWYVLHENPDVAERLHAELDAVVPRDQAPTLEHLKRLPYTMQAIKEVLRLYPPSPAQPRDPTIDHDLGGVHVPAGTDHAGVSIRHAPASRLLGRAGTLRSGSLSPRARGGSPSLRLLPVRRRPEGLHRQQLCQSRSTYPHGSARAPVQRAPRRGSPARRSKWAAR